MTNPATGELTAYEEVWKDEEHGTGLFVRNKDGTKWRARVGNWQIGLGRGEDGVFWAWQAERLQVEGESEDSDSEKWEVKHWVGSLEMVEYLPRGNEARWIAGSGVLLDGEEWSIIEKAP